MDQVACLYNMNYLIDSVLNNITLKKYLKTFNISASDTTTIF